MNYRLENLLERAVKALEKLVEYQNPNRGCPTSQNVELYVPPQIKISERSLDDAFGPRCGINDGEKGHEL